MWSAWLALVVAGPAVDVPEPPRPGAYELAWDAPESCPGADEIRASVDALLSRELDGEGLMRVRAQVESAGGAWRLRMQTDFEGSVDHREIRAETCGELGNSVALVIAAALDPAVEPPPADPEPETEPPRDPRPPPDPEPVSVVPVAPPPRPSTPPPGVRLRADLGPEWGALPGVAATIGVAAALHWKPGRVELVGRWVGLRRRAGPSTTRVAGQLFIVAARGCGHLRRGAWEFPLCAGFEAGAVRLDRERFRDDSAVHGPWLAPLIAGAAARRWGRVSLWIEAQVAVRVRGTIARSGDARLFFSAAPVSLRPLIGVEIALP